MQHHNIIPQSIFCLFAFVGRLVFVCSLFCVLPAHFSHRVLLRMLRSVIPLPLLIVRLRSVGMWPKKKRKYQKQPNDRNSPLLTWAWKQANVSSPAKRGTPRTSTSSVELTPLPSWGTTQEPHTIHPDPPISPPTHASRLECEPASRTPPPEPS